jgi:hypothetical protein
MLPYKIDQIAYVCKTSVEEFKLKQRLGLQYAEWKFDEVVAEGYIRDRHGVIKSARNIAFLQFNYDAGIELEILRYVDGPNWHEENDSDFFLSHVGAHLADGQPFPDLEDCPIVQHVFTQSHTNDYLVTGAGAGRKYEYRIHELSPGNYFKLIRRINPQ